MITRPAPVAPAKQRASNHIRTLAKKVHQTFPDMDVHQHLTDAAREIDAGRSDNAKRHLDAAISSFAPLQLIRHGIHDDEGHRAAKNYMQQAHRGRLLVQDIQSMQGENAGLAERRKDAAVSALQAKAMKNAQPAPAGKTGDDVAAPDAPEKAGSKQFTWDDVSDAIELAAKPKLGSGERFAKLSGSLAKRGVRDPDALAAWIGRRKYGAKKMGKLSHASPPADAVELVGPKGYIHGWIKVAEGEASKARKAVARNIRDEYPKPVTGRTEDSTATELMRRTGYEADRGKLGSAWKPGQATETAASGAGLPLETRRLSSSHQEAYRGLRASGHSHSAAMAIVRKMAGGIGRALDAGSATEAVTNPDIARPVTYGNRLRPVTYGEGLRPTTYGQGLRPATYGTGLRPVTYGKGLRPAHTTVQYAWEDVLDAIELSAQTGRLASEPHPFGKPGGPGLWNVKGMELPPYIQNIARALLRSGRAKSLSQAIAIAKGATNRWSHGGGHVNPEVRAASTATNASWNAKRAVAHSHANDWDHLVELTGTAAGASKDSRTPLGQFGTGGGGSGGQKAPQTRAQRKAALLARAKADRAAAKLLSIRIAADRAALASASGKVSTGQKGSTTTAKASTTKSTAPKTASPTSNAATGLTSAKVTAATTAAKASASKMNKAQLTAAIKALTTQEKNLLAAAATAASQAAKT